jgi:hypothetical protein
MGIVGFNVWMQKHFKNAYVPRSNNGNVKPPSKTNNTTNTNNNNNNNNKSNIDKSFDSFEHVYIDVNGLLHVAARRAKSEAQLFKFLFRELDFLFKFHVRPTRSVFLGVDGPASFAKLRTQRARRLLKERKALSRSGVAVSATEIVNDDTVNHDDDDDDEDDEEDDNNAAAQPPVVPNANEPFDSIAITPGTAFMARLHNALEYFVVSRIQNDFKFRQVEFFLSGSDLAGEGEVKIVHDLLFRKHRLGERLPSVLVLGSDADLILLALAARTGNVHVLGNQRSDLSYFSVSAWDREVRTLLPHASVDNVRFDFCVLALLQGNDYLPKLRKSSLSNVWARYIGLRGKPAYRNSCIVQPDRTFDWQFFAAVLLGAQQAHNVACRVRGARADVAATPIDDVVVDAAADADDDTSEFDELYGDDDANNASAVTGAEFDCAEYVQGLVWNLSMYARGHCPSVRFFYRYRRAPDCTALCEWAFRTGGDVALIEDESTALSPLVCAAALLPPSKHGLLNVARQTRSLTDVEPLLKELYARKATAVDTTEFVSLLERACTRTNAQPLSNEAHAKRFRFANQRENHHARGQGRAVLVATSPVPSVPVGQRELRTPVRVQISLLSPVLPVDVTWPVAPTPRVQPAPIAQPPRSQPQPPPPATTASVSPPLLLNQQQPPPQVTFFGGFAPLMMPPPYAHAVETPMLDASSPLAQFFPLLVHQQQPPPQAFMQAPMFFPQQQPMYLMQPETMAAAAPPVHQNQQNQQQHQQDHHQQQNHQQPQSNSDRGAKRGRWRGPRRGRGGASNN